MPSRPSARASRDSNTSNSQSPRFGGGNTSLLALLRRSLCLGGDSERVLSGQQQPCPSQAAHEQAPMPGPGPAAAAPRAAAQPAPMPAAAPPLPSPPTAPSTPAARPSPVTPPVESPSHKQQQQQQRQQEPDQRMPVATRCGSAPLPAHTTPDPAARAAAAAAEGPTADTAWRDLDGDDEEQEEEEQEQQQQQQQHEQGPQIRNAPPQAWLLPAASGAAGAGPEAKPASPKSASADTDVRALGVDDRHAGDQHPQPSATADAAEAAHPVTTAAVTAAAATALARRASCPTLLPALPEAAYDPAARTAIPPVPSAVPPVPATSAHLWRSYPATQRSSDFLSAASIFINLASRFEGVRKAAYTSSTSPAPLLQLVPPPAPGQPTPLGPWSGLAAVPAATAVRAPSAPLAATTAAAAVAAVAAGKATATRTRAGAGAASARLPLPLHEAQRAQRLHWAQQALRAQQVLKALRPPSAHTRRGASVPLMPVPPPALPDQSAPLSGQCSVNGAPAPHAEGQEPSAPPPWRGLPAHAGTQRYRTSSTTGSVGLAHAGLPSPAGLQGGPQAAEAPGATLARFRVMVQGVHQRSISGHPALATGGASSAAPGHAYGPRGGVTASTPAMGARAGFADPNTAGARRAAAVRRSDVATLE